MNAVKSMSMSIRQLRSCSQGQLRPTIRRTPSPYHERLSRTFLATCSQNKHIHTTAVNCTAPVPTATQLPSDLTSAGFPLQQPSYALTFTCKPCLYRSTHTVSKQGYHKGTVLITCPNCKSKHVMSDHLKFFADQAFTIEDLMKQKGDLVRRGSVTDDGDVEFWNEELGRTEEF